MEDMIQKLKVNYEKSVAEINYDDALSYANKLLKFDVDCMTYKMFKADSLVMLSRHEEAQYLLADILELEPTNVDAMSLLGISLYYQENIKLAFTNFDRVLEFSPGHEKTRTIYRKAKLLVTKKEEASVAYTNNNPQQALDIFTFALQIDPSNVATNAKLHFNRAIVLTKMNKLKEAVDDCTNAIKLNGKYLKAYLRRAKLYLHLEMHEECVRDYEKVYEMYKTKEYRKLLNDAKEQLKRSKRKDYYKILGVAKSATDNEIKKAYKKGAMLHHPDRHTNATEETKREEENKFKELSKAYSVLINKKKRSKH